MNSLLPIFLSSQNGSNAIRGVEIAREPLGQVTKEQTTPSDQAFARAFSQVLHEHGDTSAFLKHLQAFVSTRSQQGKALTVPLPIKDIRTLEILVGPETVEKVLAKLQVHRSHESPGDSHLPALDSDAALDLASLLSAQSLATPVVATNESVPSHDQNISIEQVSLPERVSTIPLFPNQGFQAAPRTLVQDNGFQQTGGEHPLGRVTQKSETGEKIPGMAQIPLPKVPESGLVHPQVPHVSVGKQATVGLKQEEASVRTVVPLVKEVSSGLQQVERSILVNDSRQNLILPQVSSQLARPQHVQSHHLPSATAIQEEGPAGFAGPGLTNQISMKTIPGHSSVLNDVSGAGMEHRTTVPADLPGEPGLLAKGDRGQTLAETSMKSVGVDPSGGQGPGNGMNHFSNSQSGFQQSSLSSGQGVGLRALEERGQEFPAPVLQRLQMDVQLSANQRVQIDVGVQNRQVYAGLVMDHSVLRSLANQMVPQLENQLTQVDLELQEFSAEVHEEREQGTYSMFDDSGSQEGKLSGRREQGELRSTRTLMGRQEESGLHFVA